MKLTKEQVQELKDLLIRVDVDDYDQGIVDFKFDENEFYTEIIVNTMSWDRDSENWDPYGDNDFTLLVAESSFHSDMFDSFDELKKAIFSRLEEENKRVEVL